MTYEEFVDSRLTALARYAVMLTGDSHLAQDLVQETMVRCQLAWRKVARADSPERYVQADDGQPLPGLAARVLVPVGLPAIRDR